ASSNGMFKLRVTLGTISEAPLAVAGGQMLDLEVSPWFGIASSKWRAEEVAKTVAASRELLSLPLTTLLTETLCLVPSNDPLSIGQIWGRRMVDGKLHFDQDRDVCWIHEVTDSELTLGRRSALDWRERYEGGRHFPPR